MIDINSNIYDTGQGNNAHKGPGPGLMGARTLTGDNVVNHADENLGEVKEIMLDTHTGKIAYVVVAHGGLLGIGVKLFAIPWSALTLDTVHKRFILNIEKSHFDNAPGFDPDQWPDMADEIWVDSVHAHYSTKT